MVSCDDKHSHAMSPQQPEPSLDRTLALPLAHGICCCGQDNRRTADKRTATSLALATATPPREATATSRRVVFHSSFNIHIYTVATAVVLQWQVLFLNLSPVVESRRQFLAGSGYQMNTVLG